SILYSNDSGFTWRQGFTGTRNQGRFLGISFVDSAVGYVSGPAGIFKTVNGGATWRNITSGTGRTTDFAGCRFTSRDTGVVVGGACGTNPQFFLYTTDGGNRWLTIFTAEANSKVSDAVFTPQRGLGYAVGSGTIWQTRTGGERWSLFAKTGSSNSFNDNVLHQSIATKGASFLVPFAGTDCEGQGGGGGARFRPIAVRHGENSR
ncbi:MAG: WD40/YVTN/BNR-like repeat-containing protein, partial [Gloeotrichia echinulata HAB0833]